MTNLQIVNTLFNFKNTNLTVIHNNEDDSYWFIGKEVASALGYSDTSQAIRKHCEGVVEMTLPSAGGNQNTKIIPESDIYSLIFGSSKPDAKDFKRWVTTEVLPSLRKTKEYKMEQKPMSTLEILAAQIAQMQLQEKQIQLLAEQNKVINTKLEDMSDKLENIVGANDYFTVVGFVNINKIKLPPKSENTVGRIAAKISKQRLIEVKKAPDSKYGMINSYREDVLHEAVEVFNLIN
jgi:prophage antirepressor-like protein